MAKADFSSSSPLAGSFLTGHIYLPPPWPALNPALAGGGDPVFLFFAVGQSLLCGCFILRRGLLCLRFLHEQGNRDDMS
ncbi:MAG TPA: hypothetical protein ENJ08_02330 [Gammaproteobacteria bacterium]|nr:hypothetical protein [Gammaproteobacteria bacterium]